MNDQPVSLRARFAGVLTVALALGAIDTLFTRLDQNHRPLDVALFAEAVVAWLAFALLALVPELIVDAWMRRRGRMDPSPARAAVRLAAWAALPVVVHAQINPYTELGGRTTGLHEFAPWRDALLALAIVCAAVWLASRYVVRFRAARVAWGVALVAIVCGLFVSFPRGHARSTAVPAPGKPNVLLLVWDTTRAASLDLYGYGRGTTPSLDKLGSDALLFTDTRSVATYTLTSHISLLTGVYPSHHGARMTRQAFNPIATPSVAEDFQRAGYRTGAFVGTDVLHAQTGVARGFDEFDDQVDPAVCYTHLWALVHDAQALIAQRWNIHRGNGSPHWFQDFQRPAPEVLADAEAWIANDDPRPWFCMINLYDAHWPYMPETREHEQWVRPYSGPIGGYSWRADDAPPQRDFTSADNQHLTDLYDAELAQLDREVDSFFARLDLKRTAVVMTSDHGEAFGEGGQYDHGNILECQVRVPLIVRPAGGVERRAIDVPTSGVDVAPTLLSLAGLPLESGYIGRNLLGQLDASRPLIVEDRDHYDPYNVKVASYDGTWKLVRDGLGEKRTDKLFDLSQDPMALKNVAGEHPEIVERMVQQLVAFRAKWRVDDEKDATTRGPMNDRALRSLGYIGAADTAPVDAAATTHSDGHLADTVQTTAKTPQ